MLHSTDRGYAVMNKEQTAYSFEGIDLETCKRHCRNGDVIVERIPKHCGLMVKFCWYRWEKPFERTKRWGYFNIFWLHISWQKVFNHKNGKVVYEP